jgi:hypothetical protein
LIAKINHPANLSFIYPSITRILEIVGIELVIQFHFFGHGPYKMNVGIESLTFADVGITQYVT